MGVWTASISTFAERHSAYHFDAGFNECYNLGRGNGDGRPGGCGRPRLADQNAHRDSWFLHVHMWDPHTPYRTPASFGEPFADRPIPPWLTEDVRQSTGSCPGPTRPRRWPASGRATVWDAWPRQPQQAADMDDVRRIFDGYDTGVRFADHQVGRGPRGGRAMGLAGEKGVMVSADHGENLGELGIYCDHQTADEYTTHLPVVLRWPGLEIGADRSRPGFHYQIDVMATVLELFGAEVPERWDGMSFAPALLAGRRPAATTSCSPTRPGRRSGRCGSTGGCASAPITMRTTAFPR